MKPKPQPRLHHVYPIVKNPVFESSQGNFQKLLPFVSPHALFRYQQRVDPTADRRQAIRAILLIESKAKARSTPRKWTRNGTRVKPRPGSRYLYSADYPDICLVVRDGVVVTVFSKRVCAEWKPERSERYKPAGRRASPYKRRSPSGWPPTSEDEAA